MFIDTHCHLTKEYYDDIEAVVDDALAHNVIKLINCGYDNKSNEEIINLVDQYDNMYGALGIHPHACEQDTNNYNNIKKNMSHPSIVAIGEIGLDYYYGKNKKEQQKLIFEEQLKLAQEYNYPVIIHSREAFDDTYNILSKYNVKGVIHSFSGTYEQAKKYVDKGFLLGINGIITFKNSNLLELVKDIGLEHIILETDSPYLSPVPYRGKQNTPKNTYYIAKFISENMDISLKELAKITNENIRRIFDI